MPFTLTHIGPTVAAAFLASLVEFVEALTVVLAIGTTRGWRDALLGSAAAVAVLAVLVALLGATVARVPIAALRIVVGTLLLLFGLRWLRKAVLRAAGVIPLHDEAAEFAERSRRLGALGPAATGVDTVAFGTAFNIVMLEGVEVVFIVLAVAAGGSDLLWPASLGALAALVVVVALGIVLRRPLAALPENAVKFGVGVLLSAFGTFWVGEGIGVVWPGGDLATLALAIGYAAAGIVAVRLCRHKRDLALRPEAR